MRKSAFDRWTSNEIVWRTTGDLDFPFAAEHDGHALRLRLNDFPDEPLHTLFVDGQDLGDFDDWPPRWRQP
ncbi:hypothetical protein [Sandaracinus amylolyticus]|uniref:Uncharacterized protein n=1 Tax=Sandaracinus amylolyticus TaxID=927083 RepID=A0A0F6SDM6_9BACT|nr:hypothetical protein [Sandaracinus amylolyticus]AKF03709.1 hypothetical protein DB32_000858 [Sandaracinus amylolyticus]